MGDHRGDEVEVEEGKDVKIDIATLRKKATELGAPAGLPDVALTRWIHFSTAQPPRLDRTPGGFVVSRPGKKDTQADTYGGLFQPVWEDCSFKLKCMMRCKDATISYRGCTRPHGTHLGCPAQGDPLA